MIMNKFVPFFSIILFLVSCKKDTEPIKSEIAKKDSAKTDILITEKKEKSLPTPANPFKTPTNIKLFDKKMSV